MGTSYDILYSSVLSKIKDYAFLDMSEQEIKSILLDYIRPAVNEFYLCKKDLADRDDFLEEFNDSLNEDEIEIISNYMVINYLDANYIRVPIMLKSHLSNKDFNAFSPANHLEKIMAVRNKYQTENETRLVRYSWLKGRGCNLSGFKKI